MKNYLSLSLALFIILVFSTCRKMPDAPDFSNKIEWNDPVIDTVSYFAASISETVTGLGGNDITQHGHCWSTGKEPTLKDNKTELGKLSKPGTFTSNLNNLDDNTVYHVRAYFIFNNVTVYGTEQQFNTLKSGMPVVDSLTVNNIAFQSASAKGVVIADSGLTVIKRGFCWDTDSVFTISDCLDSTVTGNGLGGFNAQITRLTEGTSYFVKAYATNEKGTEYSKMAKFTTIAVTPPEATTTQITNIRALTATGGGNVISNGNGTVSARGVCWNTTGNPTLENNIGFTTNGSGTGDFLSNVTGLTENTTYYITAYATNEKGTGYGEIIEFTTLEILLPGVTTEDIANITMNSAQSGGEITSDGNVDITGKGVCWSIVPNPTLEDNHTSDGTGNDSFVSTISGLSANTKYYLRAYATNSKGIAYGEQKEFITLSSIIPPVVSTGDVTDITQTTALGHGLVETDGGGTVTQRGFCWSTTANPTLEDNHITNGSGTGSYTGSITGLTANTLYYVRAYATNEEGTTYGNEVTFTTLEEPVLPVVTTDNISNITQTTAVSGGNVVSDGNAGVTARGVCWSTQQNPDISNDHTSDGTGTGTFTSLITGLVPNTFYYVRAYATNSVGTGYGEQKMFITPDTATIPTVTTANAINITQTGATTGGTVHADGGEPVTARGVCYSTSPTPTLANSYTTDGSGLGTFVSILDGLTPNTQYYVRAYATNSEGTAYGNEITFITLSNLTIPTVTTDPVTNITDTTATSGGNVTDDGGADVTARGVCWNTTGSPTLDDDFTTDGSGLGTFVSQLTGLTPTTTYYVRAYATNSEGTAYGNEEVFTTLDPPFQCGDSIVYEGQTYHTVSIGDQCWLKENLNVGVRIDGSQDQTNNGTIEKYCYDDDETNCDTYGGLYQWDEMMQYITTEGVQGICPDGWHLPTDDEWKILEGTVDSQYGVGDPEWDEWNDRGFDVGYNLKSTEVWQENGTGSDAFDFTALPGGATEGIAGFNAMGSYGFWWTSSLYNSSSALMRNLRSDSDLSSRTMEFFYYGYSIRCLKD